MKRPEFVLFDSTSIEQTIALALVALLLLGDGPAAGGKPARLCGWFDNPTPGNASLFDGKREWVLSEQGAPEIQGDWPVFAAGQKVSHGQGSYGYGCACLTVAIAGNEVSAIAAAQARPLRVCRGQQKLRQAERKLQ